MAQGSERMTYDHEATMAAIERQNREFDALTALAHKWASLRQVAVVDDDYPEVRHYYESALQTFLDACEANGRFRRA